MIPRASQLNNFTDIFGDQSTQENISQPISLPSSLESVPCSPRAENVNTNHTKPNRPLKHTGQHGEFRSVEEIDPKYRSLFTYPYFNLVQSRIIEDALYSDKSLVLCAPTGSGKTVAFEMAILQLLIQNEDTHYTGDFKIIYIDFKPTGNEMVFCGALASVSEQWETNNIGLKVVKRNTAAGDRALARDIFTVAPVKAVCNERLTEWYPKLTRLGLLCIEVTGDTEVDFMQLKPYKVIITTPEKWDMLTRRWRDHRGLVEMIKLFLIDEVHILNDETRGPVLEAVVSRMKTIESAAQSAHRIEQLQKQYQGFEGTVQGPPPRIRFVAVSATVSNPEDVADWLGTSDKPAVFHKFGDECRPVRLKRIVEGYPCSEGTSIFKFDLILNYKLWSIIQKYYNGKPTLIFCNTRKSVALTAEALSREITVTFNPEQKAKLTALASTLKNKKLQMLVMSGVGCHHAGMLFEERLNIERAFRERDLPILITTTTLAMGVNLPAHLVIIKNTQQYVNGTYQEYSISTVLQMVGRAGRPQFDTEATAVIMTRLSDKARYQSLVGGSEPLQSYLHKRIAENLNSEAALGTVTDVAQCVEWLRFTFLYVRAAKDPKRYLGLSPDAPMQLISKKIEELCVKAMNSLASSGLITMDDASCIESTEAGRLMSVFYLDVETMKNIMKIDGTETLERLLRLVCESHELSDMHLRMDERRCLNLLNRNNAAATIRFPMKGKINTRQMKLNCIIQAVLGCLPIPDPSLNQEAMKVMRIASRVCTCLVKYVSRPELVNQQPQFFSAVLNSILLAKCVECHLWETSPYVSKQLKGIGPTFSTLLASAGKTSFMLLEESHPRDLERIMNKGPPAGNVLRKQVSLLPKYQLTATPKNPQTITVQLMLLNHAHLSENIGNLTAGSSHRSYLLVGDSENNLLLLTSFSDNDLISVYDGTITYEIKRKLGKEHKIMVHCISSSFAGIDAQAEHLFQSLEPELPHESVYFDLPQDTPKKNTTRSQTHITDTYRERKRKNNSDLDITQCKEKKKRENALSEKLKALKESFGRTSKEMKRDIDKSTNLSCKLLSELLEKPDTPVSTGNIQKIPETVEMPTLDLTTDVITEPCEDVTIDCEDYDYVDDIQINSILNQIETEINGKDSTSNLKSGQEIFVQTAPKNHHSINEFKPKSRQINNVNNAPQPFKEPVRCSMANKDIRKRKNILPKSNYSVIEKIENKDTTEETNNVEPNNNSGFTDTIKSYISKFLEHAQKSNVPSTGINEVFHKFDGDLPEVYVKRNLNSHENTEQNINTNVIKALANNHEENNKTKIKNVSTEKNKNPDYCNHEQFEKVQKNNPEQTELLKNTIKTSSKNSDVIGQDRNTDDADGEYDTNKLLAYAQKKITDVNNSIGCENNLADTQNLSIPYESVNTSELFNVQHEDEKVVTVNCTDQKVNARKFVAPFKSETILKPMTQDFDFENVNHYNVENKFETTEVQNHFISHRYEDASSVPFNKSCVEIKNVEIIGSNTENIIDGADTANLLALQQTELALVSVTKSYNIPPENLTKCTDRTDQADARNMLIQCKPNYKYSDKESNCSQVEKNKTHNSLVPLNKQVEFKHNAIASYSTNNEIDEIDAQNIVPCRIKSNSVVHDTEKYNALTTDLVIPDRTLAVQSKQLNERKPPIPVQKPEVNINSHGQFQAPCHSNVSFYQSKHFPYVTNSSSRQQNTCDSKSYTAHSNNQTKTHYNRYCYTATRVNVCTKYTPDHQLKITRKLKVDVDITEIVTEENTKTNNTDNLQKENLHIINNMQNVSSKRVCTNGGFDRKFENNARFFTGNTSSINDKTGKLEVTELNDREQLNNGNVENLHIINNIRNVPSQRLCTNGGFDRKFENNARFLTGNTSINDKTGKLEVTELNDKEKLNNGNVENLHFINNIRNVPSKRLCNDGGFDRKFENNARVLRNDKTVGELEVTDLNDKEQLNNDNVEKPVNCTAEKSIGNILQKYSKLLVKTETNAPNINKMNKNSNGGIKTELHFNTGKTKKRPFKIRDIHHIDVALPSTIIEATSSKLETIPLQQTLVQTNEKNSPEYQDKLLEVKLEPYTVNSNSNPDIGRSPSSVESPVSIRSLDSEPEKDLENENMFDPKMLLQYFSTEDKEPEIIPPPTEFTDDVNSYSPNTSSYDYHDNANLNMSCSYAGENIDNGKDLENSYGSRMAKSQKEETWYLSRDENDYKTQHSQPFSAPRIVSQRVDSSLVSRRGRLGQFKFVRKKPLKPR